MFSKVQLCVVDSYKYCYDSAVSMTVKINMHGCCLLVFLCHLQVQYGGDVLVHGIKQDTKIISFQYYSVLLTRS